MTEPPGTARNSAVYAFVDDFIDAGIGQVADRLAGHGFGGVALATVYHAARDVLPHNPRHAVAHRDEGVHYFEPDLSVYRGLLRPQPRAGGTDGFEWVTSALAERRLWWQAWTVYLHNSRLASSFPQLAVTNAFGDIYITDLCPSSSEVATYAVELTKDVAALRPALIVAESLHHAGFSHGYHHERSFVDVRPVTAFLLSLCFCEACRARADVDSSQLAERVRRIVRDSLEGTLSLPAEVNHASLHELCGPAMNAYLAAREYTVTQLTAACADAARAVGVPFAFMDQSGAMKGYLTGAPAGPAAVDDAWQLGIDARAVSGGCDNYVMLGYARSEERVRLDLDSYAARLAPGAQLRCVLRYGPPDSAGLDDLRAKVAAAAAVNAEVDFYHYGLMPLSGLAAAARACAAAPEAEPERA